MPSYRWVVLKYPDGHTARTIILEQEINPELIALQRSYGVRYRLGPRVTKDIASLLSADSKRRRFVDRKIATPRPLSPDMGRGSGGPI